MEVKHIVVRSDDEHCIDVSFEQPPVQLHAIQLTNYYAASLTSRHALPPHSPPRTTATPPPAASAQQSSSAAWTTVLSERRLMEDPDCEEDAQDTITLYSDEFDPAFDPAETHHLRITLSQLSPLWRRFTVRDLRFFAQPTVRTGGAASPQPIACDIGATLVQELDDLALLARDARATLAELIPAHVPDDDNAHPYKLGEFDDTLELLVR